MNTKLIKENYPPLFMILFGVIIILIIPNQVSDNKISLIGPRFFPYLLASLVIFFSILTIIFNVIKQKKNPSKEEAKFKKPLKGYFRVVIIFICISLWIMLVPYIGFVITSLLLTGALMIITGNEKLYQIVITPIISVLVIYYLFQYLLNIPLPEGIFI